MPNVKILKVSRNFLYDGWGEVIPQEKLVKNDTPWHEVSEEDLFILREWADISRFENEMYLVIQELSPPQTKLLVEDILLQAKKEMEEKKRKQKEAAEKRKINQQKNKEKEIEKKRQQLEKLKKELGEVT